MYHIVNVYNPLEVIISEISRKADRVMGFYMCRTITVTRNRDAPDLAK